MELQLAVGLFGGYVLVEVDGEVDVATNERLGAYLAETRQRDTRGTIVDLSRVTFMDCSGLRVLVAAQRDATMLGGELRLAAPQPRVARLLALSGLYRLLPPFPTVEIAATARSPINIVSNTVSA